MVRDGNQPDGSSAAKLLPRQDGPAPLSPFRVLLVESDPAFSLLAEYAFKAIGIEAGLKCLTDGEEAVAYLSQQGEYADAPAPHLVFLDLSLYPLSGLDLLKWIKSNPQLVHIPVLILSGSENPKDIRAAYALHANGFLRKPWDLPQFLRSLQVCYQFWASVVTLCPDP